MSRFRVSMDIGGTFTDVVAYDETTGHFQAGKSSTTPNDLTEGVYSALTSLVESPRDISFTVHGTTQGLNAFLERRGVKVLLLASKGAGDTYHIARGPRTRLYDLHFRKPEPLVPLSDVVEIGGRFDSSSAEIEPLGRADTERVADAPGPDFQHEIREVVFGGERHQAPLVRRDALAKGHAFDGPAVVVEGTATTVVPPGSETVRRVLETVDPAELKGTIVAVPVANPYAHQALTRNTPLDGVNINRIFPGNASGSVTEQVAAALCGILEGADYFIDFHSGGNFATVEYAYIHDAGAEMSRAYGCSLLYHGTPYAGSATGWALEQGIGCMVSELGGGGQRIDEYLTKGIDGTLNVLRTVGMLPGEPAPSPADQVVVETLTVLQPAVGGVLLSDFGVDRIGERIPKGTVLGRVVSPYTSEELQVITAPYEPSILVLGRESLTNVAPGDYGFMVADGATAKPA